MTDSRRPISPEHITPLPCAFYLPSAEVVAPRLLGQWLLRKTEEGYCGGVIVETEAYLAADPASHSYGGRTERNREMWGPPGRAYVYFIYGNHFCVNAVCCPEGAAEAVLIRAIEPSFGIEILMRNRPGHSLENLTNGPGKLCAALGITRAQDGADLCDVLSPLMIAKNPEADRLVQTRGPIVAASRIGITKAADLPLRFYLDKSSSVSRRFASRKKERLPPSLPTEHH